MGDWKQLFQFAQSVFVGIVCSYLWSSHSEKKISASFAAKPALNESKRSDDDVSDSFAEENSRVSVEEQSVIEKGNEATGKSLVGDDDGVDSDDDWEDVERTELDEAFSTATVFVAAAAAD